MDFYSLPIIINDRREKVINLYHKEANSEKYNYIIECQNNAHFSLIELSSDTVLQSLITDHTDQSIPECDVQCVLTNDALQVIIGKKQQEYKEVINHTPPTPIEPQPYTYDDIELFKSAPKKEKKNHNETTIHSQSKIIGIWADTIKIVLHTYSNGAILITGYITQGLDNILTTSFPDLNLELIYEDDNTQYKNKTTLSFSHPDQYVGIALDFGSEASQMAIKRYQHSGYHQQSKPEIENLFKNILAYNEYKQWINRDTNAAYFQEERNTNFYKSIFFLKENLSGKYKNIYKDIFIANEGEDLKMIVNTHNGLQLLTQHNFHQLPNLKITQKYDNLFSQINFNYNPEGFAVNVSLGKMKSKVYNSILRVMIASFLKKEFIIDKEATKKVRFVLLVPNIYDFYDIANTQKILYEIFQSLSDNEYKDRLLSWEIITISESDASFLGYINKNDVAVEKNKEYIIIDSGKGTTDLSVIRTGKNNVYDITTIYRNGFAGAGNLITFAVFETILHYIRANAKNQTDAYKFIKEKIIAVLNSNNLELKNNIFNQIERLKFKYTSNNAYVLPQWENAQSGDTNFSNLTDEGRADITFTLQNLLSNIENISDFYGYIGEMCNVIATRTVQHIKLVKQNIPQFDCGGIVLSGRAFLFKPLEEAMKKQINDELQIDSDSIHILKGNELKDICIKGVFNTSVRINAERIGYPLQLIKNKETQNNSSSVNKNKSRDGKPIKSWFMKTFFNELDDLSNLKAVIPTATDDLQFDELALSQLIIGSKRYKITGNKIYNKQEGIHESANLMFTERGYLVRRLENGIVKNVFNLEDISNLEDKELSMVIPSLFPNFIDEEFIHSFQEAITLSPNHSSSHNDDKYTPPQEPIYF